MSKSTTSESNSNKAQKTNEGEPLTLAKALLKENGIVRSLVEITSVSQTLRLLEAGIFEKHKLPGMCNMKRGGNEIKLYRAMVGTPETPAAAAAAALTVALTGETKSSTATTTGTILMYKSSSLLTALELQHSVSPTLHAALSNARDEICGGSSDSAGGPASALHDIDHELFQSFSKKGKASVLERLRCGIIIRTKILNEDIRVSLWKGLEDPKHLDTIKQYKKKLQRFGGGGGGEQRGAGGGKQRNNNQNKKKFKEKDLKYVNELITQCKSDESKRNSSGNTRRVQQFDKPINLSKLTDQSRTAMTKLNQTFEQLMAEHGLLYSRMSRFKSISDLSNTQLEYEKLRQIVQKFSMAFDEQAKQVMESVCNVPSGQERKDILGISYQIGRRIRVYWNALCNFQKIVKPRQQKYLPGNISTKRRGATSAAAGGGETKASTTGVVKGEEEWSSVPGKFLAVSLPSRMLVDQTELEQESNVVSSESLVTKKKKKKKRKKKKRRKRRKVVVYCDKMQVATMTSWIVLYLKTKLRSSKEQTQVSGQKSCT